MQGERLGGVAAASVGFGGRRSFHERMEARGNRILILECTVRNIHTPNLVPPPIKKPMPANEGALRIVGSRRPKGERAFTLARRPARRWPSAPTPAEASPARTC
eukprot:SAG11_NODE_8107_length_1059_cov_1.551042_1_plen_103_part_10